MDRRHFLLTSLAGVLVAPPGAEALGYLAKAQEVYGWAGVESNTLMVLPFL